MFLDIYSYQSAYQYVQDYYQLQKEHASITLRDWAKDMGLESPVLLIDILKKKRPLKLKYASFLSKGLKLNENQTIYFMTLIQMNKALDEDKEYFTKLLDTLKPYPSVDPHGDVFSHWLTGSILALGKAKNFSLDVQNIHAALEGRASIKDIQNAMTILYEKGLFERVNHQVYKRKSVEFISTKNDTSIDSTKQYYRQMIKRAETAIDQSVEEREFQCFSICTDQNKIHQVKSILRNTRHELAALYAEDGDSLFHFNLMGFPLGRINHENLRV